MNICRQLDWPLRFGRLLALLFLSAQLAAQEPGELRLVLPNVQFAAEKSAVGAQAAAELSRVAALMKKSPGVTLEVGVHTDASGSAAYNLRLSQRRAQAVFSHLTKNGVSAKRLKVNGYGETKPLNRCRRGVRCSEAEKRENRRVELRVLGLAAGAPEREEWLALGSPTPKKPLTAPENSKMPPSQPTAAYQTVKKDSSPPSIPAGQAAGDYFPELRGDQDAASEPRHEPQPDDRQFVPGPLPATFIGYTIEVACPEKPYPAGHNLLRQYKPVFLRHQADGAYCYYIGAFHTLTEATQFLRTEALPRFPKAQVVAFANNEKNYFKH